MLGARRAHGPDARAADRRERRPARSAARSPPRRTPTHRSRRRRARRHRAARRGRQRRSRGGARGRRRRDRLHRCRRPRSRMRARACARRCRWSSAPPGHDEPASGARSRRSPSRVPVVMAPNMSLGVNLLFKLAERAARALDAGATTSRSSRRTTATRWMRRPAPRWRSGARWRRGAAPTLEQVAVYARHGATGPRRRGAIGFAVVRGGDIVGDHRRDLRGAGRAGRARRTRRRTARASPAARCGGALGRRAAGGPLMRMSGLYLDAWSVAAAAPQSRAVGATRGFPGRAVISGRESSTADITWTPPGPANVQICF